VVNVETVDDLKAWASDPQARSRYSPFGQQPFLLCQLKKSAKASAQVIRWLNDLPCPTIAIAPTQSALTEAFDVVVDDSAKVAPLEQSIRKSPTAASVLVQLLRATEDLDFTEALIAESLAYATLQSGPEFARWLKDNRAEKPAQHTDDGPAVLVTRLGHTLDLELNRPSLHNAMTVEMRDALIEALQLAIADRSIRKVRIRGRGKCFSTGGDLTEFGTLPDPASAHLIRNLALPGRVLAQCADRAEALLHGACVGSGAEFPLFAGQVVAAADTWFQLPELQFGLIPGAGGCVSIPRRIGRQRAGWLMLSGKRIDAKRALEWGLIDEVVSSHRSR
jgi:enoyl-CoA hydratase